MLRVLCREAEMDVEQVHEDEIQSDESWKNQEDLVFVSENSPHPVVKFVSDEELTRTSSRISISSFFRKFPYLMLLFCFLEIIFHNLAGDELKRLFVYDAKRKAEIWRFITYMLVHNDALHLGLNAAIQGLLGAPLEAEQDRSRCAAVYLGGGLAGALGVSVCSDPQLLAGASGGVYALLFSHLPNVLLNRATVSYGMQRIAAVVAVTLGDVIHLSCHIYFRKNESPRIGWAAHIFGAFSGLLVGFITFRGTSKYRRKFQLASWALLLITCTVALTRTIYVHRMNQFSS